MLQSFHRLRRGILAGPSLALLLAAAGCGQGKSEGLPSDEVARRALEASLTAWRDGAKPGPVAGTQPPVVAYDTPWSKGDRLSSFEIVKEDVKASEMKFSVRLSLAKPDRVQEAEYYVLGRDPVMVFRDEDYERNINMVNGPDATKPGRARGRR